MAMDLGALLGGGSGGLGGLYLPLQIFASIFDASQTAGAESQSRAENAELLTGLLESAAIMGGRRDAENKIGQYLADQAVERWNPDADNGPGKPKGAWEYTTIKGPRNPLAQFLESSSSWTTNQKTADDLALETYSNFKNDLNRDYEARTGKYLGEWDAFAQRMQGLQDAKGTELKGLMQGLGNQAKKDLNTAFDANAGGILQDMVSRGLSGTTALGSMLTGNTRERADSMGRLNEGLRREQIGLMDKLTGEQLNLTSEMGTGRLNLDMGLTTDALNARTSTNENWMNMRNSATDRMLNLQREIASMQQGYADAGANAWMNTIGGVNVQYPDLGSMNQRMAAAGFGFQGDQRATKAEAAASRRTFSNMWGLGGGGGAAAGAGIGAAAALTGGLALPAIGLPALTATGLGMTALGGAAVGGAGGYMWGSQGGR